jgi:ribosomal protein L40E
MPGHWEILTKDGMLGPLPNHRLKQLIELGTVNPETLLRRTGETEWRPAARLRGVFPGPTGLEPADDPGESEAADGDIDFPIFFATPAVPVVTTAQPPEPELPISVETIKPLEVRFVPPVQLDASDVAPADEISVEPSSNRQSVRFRVCSFCESELSQTAIKCRHCGEFLSRPTWSIREPVWNPGVAAVLAFCLPGCGHIYKGHIWQGMGLLLTALVLYAFLPFLVFTVTSGYYFAAIAKKQDDRAALLFALGFILIATSLVLSLVIHCWAVLSAYKDEGARQS